jgi:hypothetical protein
VLLAKRNAPQSLNFSLFAALPSLRLVLLMITLFAIPKAFRGHINITQRNAIQSWMHLNPRPEIILLGDDEGTAEVAAEFGLKHIPTIGRNEYGTPLMSFLFEIAQQVSDTPFYLYVNSDIILLDDFMQAVQKISFKRFMLTGQRLNLDVTEAIDFNGDWQKKWRDRANQFGVLEGHHATDYFLFTKGTYTEIPPFAIGRLCWDNWMLYKALNLNIPLIDATQAITAIHENHDYNHHPQGKEGVFKGPEAAENLRLLGGLHYTYFMLDLATWQLTPTGLQRPSWTWGRVDRYLDMTGLARPHLRPVFNMLLSWVRKRSYIESVFTKANQIPTKIAHKLDVK